MAEPAPGGEPGAGENAELPEAQTAPSGAASAAFAPWPRLAGTVQDVLGSPMGWGSRFSLCSPREGEESRASAEVCVCVHSGEHRTCGPGFSAFLFKPLELVFCMTWLCLQSQEHSGCPTSSPLVWARERQLRASASGPSHTFLDLLLSRQELEEAGLSLSAEERPLQTVGLLFRRTWLGQDRGQRLRGAEPSVHKASLEASRRHHDSFPIRK